MKINKHQSLPLTFGTLADAPCFSEVAFIASELADRTTLIQTLRKGVTHVILDDAEDGIAQIARYLSNHQIRVLHIVSHGGAGLVELGSTRLSQYTLKEYESELREIGQLLDADAEIHVYSCNVASTSAGVAFVEQLSEITCASVAASENLTGSASLGGDWDLETHIGQISAPMAFDVTAVQAFAGVLAASDENFDGRGQTDTTATSVNVGNWTFTANINSEFVVSDDNYYPGYLNGSGDKSLIWNADATAANQFNFYATDLSAFKLNSFQLGALAGSTSITIYSYLNNSQLTSATFNLNQSATLGGITYSKDSNGNFGTLTFDSTFQNIDKIQLIFSGSSTPEIDSIDVSPAVIPPTITSATFDASTGVLTVTGTNLTASAGNDVDVSKLSLSGEGGSPYTLTSSGVEITSSTSFSVSLNGTDLAAVKQFLNKNGTSSTSGTTYNIGGALGWLTADASASDPSGNGVTVTNVAVPAITSATYDAATGTLVVTGSGFLLLSGVSNDIDVSKLTLTGEGGSTYTLTTSNVEITSGTSFTVSLNATDLANVNQIINKNGTSATGAITYNLAAAENWAAGADAAVVVADLTGNGITASNVPIPAITSATYDGNTGVVVVTGTGFTHLSGATNDIVANKFTFTGEGGATYTLTDTANVEITSGTRFTLTLSATDKTAVDLLLNQNGTSSAGASTYNIAAANGWAAGASSVITTDASGNAITVSNAVDTIPPAAPTTPDLAAGSDSGSSNTDNNTNAGSLLLSGTAEVGSTVTLYRSTTGIGPGSIVATNIATDLAGNWSYTDNALADGQYYYGTKATDASNNVSALSSLLTVMVDTTPPSAPSEADLTALSDSGVSNSDDITNDTTPSFTGTSEANATVVLYDTDGTTQLASTTADGSGNWSATSSTLSAGNHTLTTKATDAAGNTSNASTGLAVSVDTTVPTVTSINRAGSALVNGSTTSVDYTVTFAEGVSGVDTSDFTLTPTGTASGSINSVTQVSASTYTVTVNSLSGDGSMRLDLKNSGTGITDTAGNAIAAGYTAGQTYTLDSVVPAVTSVSVPANSTYIAGQNLDFTVSFAEAVIVNTAGGTPYFALTLDTGGNVQAAYLSGSGTTALVFRYTVLSGEEDLNGVSVGASINANGGTLQDAAGNNAVLTLNSVGSTSAVLVDAVVPTTTVVTATLLADTGTSSTDFITKTAAQTISGTLSANLVTGETVEISLDNGATWNTATSTVGLNSWSQNGVTLAGSDTLKVRVTDPSGGGTAYSHAYVLDTTSPNAPSTPDLAAGSDSGTSSTDDVTNDTTPTLTGTAETNSTVTLFDTDGTTVLGTTTADGSGNWSLTSSALTSGAHTLTTKATDVAGNVSSASSGLSVTIDTTAPAAPAAPDMTVGTDSGISNTDNITSNTTPTFTGTAAASATVTLYDTDGTTVLGTTTADVGGNWTMTSSTLTDGSHTLTTKASDIAGNSSAASPSLGVTIDSTAPTLQSSTPADNATSVAVASNIVLTFAEDVSAVAGKTVNLYKTTGNVLVESIAVNDVAKVTIAAGTVTINPTADFTETTDYYVLVDNGAFMDSAGNVYGGITSTTDLGFTTLTTPPPSAGNTAPSLAASTPTDNASEVPVDANIILTFSESILAGSGNIVISNASNARNVADIRVISIDDPQVSIVRNTLTINLSQDLQAHSTYHVLIDDSAITDLSGLAFPGISTTSALDFVTASDSSEGSGSTPEPFSRFVDTDLDGFPDALEVLNGLVVGVRDNDVLARDDLFVMQLYRDILYREADSGGLSFWTQILEQNLLSRERVAEAFIDSSEFQDIVGSVARLYFGTFDRMPDQAGLNYWVETLRAGASLSDIGDAFVASEEFSNLYGALDGAGFPAPLYNIILHREADLPGMQYWQTQLAAGVSKGQVLSLFTNSPEFEASSLPAITATLTSLGLLGALPAQTTLDALVEDVTSGTPLVEIIGTMLASSDYHDRFL